MNNKKDLSPKEIINAVCGHWPVLLTITILLVSSILLLGTDSQAIATCKIDMTPIDEVFFHDLQLHYISPEKIVTLMSDQESMDGYIDSMGLDTENHSISANEDISFSSFRINEIEYIDIAFTEPSFELSFYENLSQILIKETERKMKDIYTYEISSLKDIIETYMLTTEHMSKSEENHLNKTLDSLNIFSDNIQNFKLEYEDISIVQTSRFSNFKNIIILTAVGLFIGIAISILIAFLDNHLYTSESILGCISEEDYCCAIPAMQKNNDIEDFHVDYINGQLGNSYSDIIVSSISENAGKHTLASKLADKNDSSNIIEGKSFHENPDSLFKQAENSITLLIIKAGTDKANELYLIAQKLKQAGINVKYIFNFADSQDSHVMNVHENANTWKINNFKTLKSNYRKYYKQLH